MNLQDTRQAAWPADQLCEQYLPHQQDVYKMLSGRCSDSICECIGSVQLILQGDDANSLLECGAEQ